MKFFFVIFSFVTVLFCTPINATTLKLSNEIDLLVIDGKKVSNTMLKGADGLELASGQHQVLFRIKQLVSKSSKNQFLFTSTPLIVSFNVNDAKTITIQLPKLVSETDVNRFNKTPVFTVVDENNHVIPSVQDKLQLKGVIISANFEAEMAKYNSTNNVASLISLSKITNEIITKQQDISTNSESLIKQPLLQLDGQNIPEQMLQYWYQQADKETQQRFQSWSEKNSK